MPLTYKTVGSSYLVAAYSTLFPATGSFGTITSSSVVINLSPNYTSYTITRTPVAGGSAVILTGIAGPTYTDTGLAGTTQYAYSIVGSNAYTTTGAVSLGTITTLVAISAFGTPTGTSSTAGQVVLSWTGGTGTGVTYTYTIYRSATLLALTTDYTVSGTASPVTITFTNTAAASYTFAVTATSGATTLTSPTSASVNSASPFPPLMVYYPLVSNYSNYATGSAVNDTNTSAATISSTVKISSNVSGSLYCNGTYVVQNVPFTPPATGGFTMSFWVYITSTSAGYTVPISFATNTSFTSFDGTMLQFNSPGATLTNYLTGGTEALAPSITLSTWTQYVLNVATNGTIRTFVNGTYNRTVTGSAYIPSGKYICLACAGGNGTGYNNIVGNLSKFRIFNGLLTDSQVSQLYTLDTAQNI